MLLSRVLLVLCLHGSPPARLEARWEPPQLLVSKAPDFPAAAVEAQQQGDVVMRLTVDEDGRVTDVVVTRAPSEILARAAAEAAYRFRFVPAHRGLKAEPSIVRYVFRFRLS
ncbi:MAG TPA: TonB family protein [Myxococcales bacterium]|nr:TonB family protein [Myxococcales bacterium]